jgi:hypothetical protein
MTREFFARFTLQNMALPVFCSLRHLSLSTFLAAADVPLMQWFPICVPLNPWIHSCNGYFEVYLLLNYRKSLVLKIIAERL